MTDNKQKKIKKIPLHDLHCHNGAKMVDFFGWQMPIQYSSIVKEHNGVRDAVGIFDVSHMGEFLFTGEGCFDFVNSLISNNLHKIKIGKAIYSGMLYENATFVDDVIVYLLEKDKILMVVNASNIEKDFQWISEKLHFSSFKDKVSLRNVSDDYCLLAIQGKQSEEVISKMFPNLHNKIPFHFEIYPYKNESIIIANTGYTGEKGIEIFADPKLAEKIFSDAISLGVIPCGLGARDSLRLEKGYSLYGHEIHDKTNPLEGGLMWTVDMEQEFIGKEALQKIIDNGAKKKLVGLLLEKGIARDGDVIYNQNDQVIGKVSSGTFSPTLKKGIALGFVNKENSLKEVSVSIREKKYLAKIVKRVFV